MVIPIFAWSVTGLIFFIKPGYAGAYEQLAIKTYPLEQDFIIKPQDNWQEVKLIKTVLGKHLLIKQAGNYLNMDVKTLEPKLQPKPELLTQLIDDAISINRERYGEIISIVDLVAQTSTDVEITLDWNTMRLRQKGRDTRLINNIYKVHYLQWSPSKTFNQFLGFLGLFLLVFMSFLGIRIYLKSRR